MADDQVPLENYRGNCHCGAFVYEIKAPEIKSYWSCNCSICHKKAYAWIDQRGDVTFVKGSADGLTSYKLKGGKYAHQFCPTCGTAVMGSGEGFDRINGRTIQNLDIWSLKVQTYDGKALPPPYAAPVYKGPEPTAEIEDGNTYHGSCHCGAITMALKFKNFEKWDYSFDEDGVVECNCSLCARIGYVWVYPKKEQTNIIGRENCTYYLFNARVSRKMFCKNCGVHVCNEANELTDEEIQKLSEDDRASHRSHSLQCNINIRILNDLDSDTLKCSRLDGRGEIEGDYVDP